MKSALSAAEQQNPSLQAGKGRAKA